MAPVEQVPALRPEDGLLYPPGLLTPAVLSVNSSSFIDSYLTQTSENFTRHDLSDCESTDQISSKARSFPVVTDSPTNGTPFSFVPNEHYFFTADSGVSGVGLKETYSSQDDAVVHNHGHLDFDDLSCFTDQRSLFCPVNQIDSLSSSPASGISSASLGNTSHLDACLRSCIAPEHLKIYHNWLNKIPGVLLHRLSDEEIRSYAAPTLIESFVNSTSPLLPKTHSAAIMGRSRKKSSNAVERTESVRKELLKPAKTVSPTKMINRKRVRDSSPTTVVDDVEVIVASLVSSVSVEKADDAQGSYMIAQKKRRSTAAIPNEQQSSTGKQIEPKLLRSRRVTRSTSEAGSDKCQITSPNKEKTLAPLSTCSPKSSNIPHLNNSDNVDKKAQPDSLPSIGKRKRKDSRVGKSLKVIKSKLNTENVNSDPTDVTEAIVLNKNELAIVSGPQPKRRKTRTTRKKVPTPVNDLLNILSEDNTYQGVNSENSTVTKYELKLLGSMKPSVDGSSPPPHSSLSDLERSSLSKPRDGAGIVVTENAFKDLDEGVLDTCRPNKPKSIRSKTCSSRSINRRARPESASSRTKKPIIPSLPIGEVTPLEVIHNSSPSNSRSNAIQNRGRFDSSLRYNNIQSEAQKADSYNADTHFMKKKVNVQGNKTPKKIGDEHSLKVKEHVSNSPSVNQTVFNSAAELLRSPTKVLMNDAEEKSPKLRKGASKIYSPSVQNSHFDLNPQIDNADSCSSFENPSDVSIISSKSCSTSSSYVDQDVLDQNLDIPACTTASMPSGTDDKVNVNEMDVIDLCSSSYFLWLDDESSCNINVPKPIAEQDPCGLVFEHADRSTLNPASNYSPVEDSGSIKKTPEKNISSKRRRKITPTNSIESADSQVQVPVNQSQLPTVTSYNEIHVEAPSNEHEKGNSKAKPSNSASRQTSKERKSKPSNESKKRQSTKKNSALSSGGKKSQLKPSPEIIRKSDSSEVISLKPFSPQSTHENSYFSESAPVKSYFSELVLIEEKQRLQGAKMKQSIQETEMKQSKLESEKNPSKPVTVEKPDKPVIVMRPNKQVTEMKQSKLETEKKPSKQVTEKRPSKQATEKNQSKQETEKKPSKQETEKKPSKQGTVKKPSRQETEQKHSKLETDKKLSKQVTVKKPSNHATETNQRKLETEKNQSKLESEHKHSKQETGKKQSKQETIQKQRSKHETEQKHSKPEAGKNQRKQEAEKKQSKQETEQKNINIETKTLPNQNNKIVVSPTFTALEDSSRKIIQEHENVSSEISLKTVCIKTTNQREPESKTPTLNRALDVENSKEKAIAKEMSSKRLNSELKESSRLPEIDVSCKNGGKIRSASSGSSSSDGSSRRRSSSRSRSRSRSKSRSRSRSSTSSRSSSSSSRSCSRSGSPKFPDNKKADLTTCTVGPTKSHSASCVNEVKSTKDCRPDKTEDAFKASVSVAVRNQQFSFSERVTEDSFDKLSSSCFNTTLSSFRPIVKEPVKPTNVWKVGKDDNLTNRLSSRENKIHPAKAVSASAAFEGRNRPAVNTTRRQFLQDDVPFTNQGNDKLSRLNLLYFHSLGNKHSGDEMSDDDAEELEEKRPVSATKPNEEINAIYDQVSKFKEGLRVDPLIVSNFQMTSFQEFFKSKVGNYCIKFTMSNKCEAGNKCPLLHKYEENIFHGDPDEVWLLINLFIVTCSYMAPDLFVLSIKSLRNADENAAVYKILVLVEYLFIQCPNYGKTPGFLRCLNESLEGLKHCGMIESDIFKEVVTHISENPYLLQPSYHKHLNFILRKMLESLPKISSFHDVLETLLLNKKYLISSDLVDALLYEYNTWISKDKFLFPIAHQIMKLSDRELAQLCHFEVLRQLCAYLKVAKFSLVELFEAKLMSAEENIDPISNPTNDISWVLKRNETTQKAYGPLVRAESAFLLPNNGPSKHPEDSKDVQMPQIQPCKELAKVKEACKRYMENKQKIPFILKLHVCSTQLSFALKNELISWLADYFDQHPQLMAFYFDTVQAAVSRHNNPDNKLEEDYSSDLYWALGVALFLKAARKNDWKVALEIFTHLRNANIVPQNINLNIIDSKTSQVDLVFLMIEVFVRNKEWQLATSFILDSRLLSSKQNWAYKGDRSDIHRLLELLTENICQPITYDSYVLINSIIDASNNLLYPHNLLNTAAVMMDALFTMEGSKARDSCNMGLNLFDLIVKKAVDIEIVSEHLRISDTTLKAMLIFSVENDRPFSNLYYIGVRRLLYPVHSPPVKGFVRLVFLQHYSKQEMKAIITSWLENLLHHTVLNQSNTKNVCFDIVIKMGTIPECVYDNYTSLIRSLVGTSDQSICLNMVLDSLRPPLKIDAKKEKSLNEVEIRLRPQSVFFYLDSLKLKMPF